MPRNQNRPGETNHTFKLIYNPNAGKKRRFLTSKSTSPNLEDIKFCFDKYQIPVDYYPTRAPGHASVLAREALKEGYKGVIAAGGDGTIGETANGLIGSNMPLGIIPLGSFMNVARMLSIPADIEKAVQLIKIGRMRKIDAGRVIMINGQELLTGQTKKTGIIEETSGHPVRADLNSPYYFLESAGVGLQAQLHSHVNELENGNLKEIFKVIKTLLDFYAFKITLGIDGKNITSRVAAIDISNGAFSGASLKLAPEAKLNDHRLTVTVYKLGKFEFLRVLFRLFRGRKYPKRRIETLQGRNVSLISGRKYLVHVDGRVYGTTDAEFEIVPNALTMITGFPDPEETFLEKRTYLDP